MTATDKIEIAVDEILSKYNIECAPIDIFDLVEREGMRVIVDEMETDHSGFLLVEEGRKPIIGINKRHHPNRRRFTAAHELGHYLLHVTEEDRFFVDKAYFRSPLSSEGTDLREIEANRFAACLLMPENFLLSDTGDSQLMDIDVYRLAGRYGVSEEAMALRLAKLELIEPF